MNLSNESPLSVYDIKEVIGEGGGGKVMLAFHKRLEKKVVIKKIHDYVYADARRVEVDILKNLRHSYIPQVLDYFVIDNSAYTVMDYIEGESFQSLLDKGVKFKENQVIKYGKQLCEAVEYLHSRSIPVIHGDIKPDNIMLTPEDNICLIDFNISGISEGNQAFTIGYSKGYSAPEQVKAFEAIMRQKKEVKLTEKKVDETEVLSGTEILDKTEFIDESETDLIRDNQTELLQTNETEVLPESQISMSNSQSDSNVSSANIARVPIDKRSDVYSIGATLFHIYTGKRIDKVEKKVLKSSTSEGYLYILNKALQDNPANRFSSAGEMLKAFNSIHKKEKKYKRMVIRHYITTVMLFFLMLLGIALLLSGLQKKQHEQVEMYDEYISQLEQFDSSRNIEEFNELYDQAILLNPSREEAYYQKARFLFVKKEYEEDIEYIEDTVLSGRVNNSDVVSSMYYIDGNAYYAIEIYDEAVRAFEKALWHDDSDGNIYTDYAIALVKTGENSKAKEALNKAEENGADKSFIYLAKGEIEYSEGLYQDCINSMQECINISTDDYRKMCAYSTRNKAITKDLSVENIEYANSLLDQGINELGIEYRGYLVSLKADNCVSAYSLTNDDEYAMQAISQLDDLISSGWANIGTYNNIIILCSKIGDIDRAQIYMEKMVSLYSGNYNTTKRLAFLELEIQDKKSENNRNYEKFCEYYERVKEEYDEQAKGKSDPEMQLLDQNYQMLIDGKWIE